MNTILAFTGAALAFHLFCGVVSAGFFSAYVQRNGGDMDDVRRHRLAVVAMGVVGLLIAWACEHTTYGWKRFW